jgi:hypothetical protein
MEFGKTPTAAATIEAPVTPKVLHGGVAENGSDLTYHRMWDSGISDAKSQKVSCALPVCGMALCAIVGLDGTN